MPGTPLSLHEREEIAAALIENGSRCWAEIARRFGRHLTTAMREVEASGGRGDYRPAVADRGVERCPSRLEHPPQPRTRAARPPTCGYTALRHCVRRDPNGGQKVPTWAEISGSTGVVAEIRERSGRVWIHAETPYEAGLQLREALATPSVLLSAPPGHDRPVSDELAKLAALHRSRALSGPEWDKRRRTSLEYRPTDVSGPSTLSPSFINFTNQALSQTTNTRGRN